MQLIKEKIISAYEQMAERYNELIDHKPHNACKGQLVISIEHPFFEYNYFNSEKYFEIEHVKCTWKGFGTPVEVNSFRRPLGECLLPITNNGFYIDKLIEPKPTKEFERLDPRHFKELNDFPGFMCIRAVKRTAQ